MKNWNYLKNTTQNASKSAIKNDKNHRPPFKWAGAKNRMFARYAASGFFTNQDPKLFVDMFAGTGAVGWWVAKNYPNTTVVLNETCDELINMYRMMQRNTFASFEQEYQKHVAAYASYQFPEDRKKHYYALRDRYALNYQTMNPIEQAAALFYMLQTGFNGIWQTSDNFNNRYASPAGLMTWKPHGDLFNRNRIKKYAEFIDKCVLVSGDFEKTQCFMNSNSWFYADPPYRLSKAKYASAGEFGDYDQVRLCDFLKAAHSCGDLAVMSNRENPDVDDQEGLVGSVQNGWFADKFNDDWNVKYYRVKYTAGRHNKGQLGSEVLIKNY